MKPGQIFGVAERRFSDGYRRYRGAYVVVDAKTEIEFWTGAQAASGDVEPSTEVEVLA